MCVDYSLPHYKVNEKTVNKIWLYDLNLKVEKIILFFLAKLSVKLYHHKYDNSS